ncbi:MAG: integration host factor subunit beta [Proteobacteria bacterium]|nr:integration host factor subunit beta [Pseudomonadota bacterium]
MLKRELIAALTRRHKELKAQDVDLIARLIFESMADALSRGEEIELRGFGSFRIRDYEPRAARNPGTGETVQLDARRGVLFKAGLEMRGRLNGR